MSEDAKSEKNVVQSLAKGFQVLQAFTSDEPELAALAQDCTAIASWMAAEASLDDRLAGSVPFLDMCAVAVAGWQLLLQARAAQAEGGTLAMTKPVVARYFLDHLVPEARGLKASATAGAALLYALDAAALAG